METHFVRAVDGVTLAMHHFASDVKHDVPVLLVHGTSSNVTSCARLAGVLAANGFECWVLEFRGHGRSEPTQDATFEQLSSLDLPAAVHFLRHRLSTKQLLLVGHSGGGLIGAMALARDFESSRGICGVVLLGSQATEAGRSMLHKLILCIGRLVNRLFGRFPGRLGRVGPEDELQGVMEQWFTWNAKRAWIGADGFDYLKALEGVRVPALVIAGAADRLIAPVEGCQKVFEALGSADKRFLVCGRAHGFSADFTHAGLVSGGLARGELFPQILSWLVAHASRVGSGGAA